jgi:hypothetical protein
MATECIVELSARTRTGGTAKVLVTVRDVAIENAQSVAYKTFLDLIEAPPNGIFARVVSTHEITDIETRQEQS